MGAQILYLVQLGLTVLYTVCTHCTHCVVNSVYTLCTHCVVNSVYTGWGTTAGSYRVSKSFVTPPILQRKYPVG